MFKKYGIICLVVVLLFGNTSVAGVTANTLVEAEPTLGLKHEILSCEVDRQEYWAYEARFGLSNLYVRGKSKYPGATVVVSFELGNTQYMDKIGTVDENGNFEVCIGKWDIHATVKVRLTSEGSQAGCVVAEDSDEWQSIIERHSREHYTELLSVYPKIKNELTTRTKNIRLETFDLVGDLVVIIGKKVLDTYPVGDFDVGAKIKKQKLGTKITIGIYRWFDRADDEILELGTYIVQLQKATAKKIKPTAKKITGTGYAGSIIKIYKGKKLIGKATCTKKGKYTVKVKKPKLLKKGAGIRIVSTAKAKGKLFKSEAVVKVK